MMALENDTRAPDFELPDQDGRPVRLSSYLGRPVALVFFPHAFSDVCTGELCQLRDHAELFEGRNVTLLGISVDSRHALAAWRTAENTRFRLLSDFWPHGEVAKEYGVFLPERGIANRATFLLDDRGMIRRSFISSPSEPRSIDAYRTALDELSSRGA